LPVFLPVRIPADTHSTRRQAAEWGFYSMVFTCVAAISAPVWPAPLHAAAPLFEQPWNNKAIQKNNGPEGI
jgi:hypothetical protein